MEETEHGRWGLVVQFFPYEGVDVAGKKGHVSLDQMVEPSTFWQYHADELVVAFNLCFLKGRGWITVKHGSTPLP